MSFSDNLKGILLTPPFYAEIEGAYRSQADYLRHHADDTDAPKGLSRELGRDLLAAQHESISARYTEPDFLGGIAVTYSTRAQELPKLSGIAIEAADVVHLTEGLFRQAVSLLLVARENEGTLAGLLAAKSGNHKIDLAFEMRNTCQATQFGRKEIPAHYALGYKLPLPARPDASPDN